MFSKVQLGYANLREGPSVDPSSLLRNRDGLGISASKLYYSSSQKNIGI